MWRLMARRGFGPTPAADLSLSLVFLRDHTKSRLRPSTQTISLWVKANHSAQQQRTYYDARGDSLGRSTPDSQGTVTNTDSRGRTPLLGGGSETFRKLRAPEGFRSPVGKPGRAHRFCSGLPVGNWAELGISGHFSLRSGLLAKPNIIQSRATDLIDARSLYNANQGDGFMKGTFIFGFMLLSVLVGSQGFAQAVDQPAQHIDGKSLSTPEQERAAKDAMNTPSGQMGKDEPGTHELRETKPSSGRPERPSPLGTERTTGQR